MRKVICGVGKIIMILDSKEDILIMLISIYLILEESFVLM